MNVKGRFIIYEKGVDEPIILPNTLTIQGQQAIMRAVFRDEAGMIPATAGNWFLGLMGLAFSITDTLLTIGGEPSGTGGYARQAIPRNLGSWTMTEPNNQCLMRSIIANFTPVAADFSVPIRRMFLCSVNAGTGGILYSVSAPFSVDRPVTVANPLAVQYEVYMRS